MSIVRCIAKLNRELREFNTGEVKDAAQAYRARNLEEREANIKAVEDHLRDLTQQRSRMVDQVFDAWKARDPEGHAKAMESLAPKEAPKPEEKYVPTKEELAQVPFARTKGQTDTPEFREWFGDSKVVDASGKPLVVYHGTTEDFNAFAPSKTGLRTGNKYGTGALFFTSDKESASAYSTGTLAGQAKSLADMHPEDRPNVVPAYLSLRKPLEIDANDRSWMTVKDRIVGAKKQGYDGVIVRNVLDHADIITALDRGPIDVYVAFRPEQVKSAIGNRGTFDKANPDIRMRRSEPRGGMESKAVEDIAQKITATWRNAPDVVVVDSLDDPRVPARVRETDQAQRAQGAEGQPAAFFYGDKVYLVASESKSPRDVTTYLFHEALGHYGLRGVFGDKLDNVLRMVASARRTEVEAKAAQYGLDMKNPDHVLSAAEEVLAELAQKRPEISFVKRAVAAVRQYLRDLGLDLDLTDADIIHNFITPARDFVERGKSVKRGEEAVQFHRGYHGTPHDFEKFSTDKIGTGEGHQAFGHGLYFSGKREVAEWYKEGLTRNVRDNDPVRIERHKALIAALKREDDLGFDYPNQAIAAMRSHPDWATRWEVAHPEELRRALEQYDRRVKELSGRLYEVELAPKEDEYLQWDEPMSKQSDKVRAALEKADWPGDVIPAWQKNGAWDHVTGDSLYRRLSEAVGGDRAASQFLADHDIPGIKYREGASRNLRILSPKESTSEKWVVGPRMGDKAQQHYFDDEAKARAYYDSQVQHNYVIFDDKHVSVVAKFARAVEAKPEDVRDTPTKGKPYDSVKDIAKSWVEELQKAVTPMAAGSDRARAVAKDFANAERLAREQWAQYHDKLTKTFTSEQLKRMWDAADEQNVLMQEGKPTAGKGLDTLEPKERQAVEQMHTYANGLLAQAKEVGMFKGEGLPYWTPRVVANIGKDGEFLSEPGKAEGSRQPFTSPTGKNITTTAASLKHREHLTTAETEAAAKAKFGEDAQVVRDIRTMPMAMARLERAIAGRKLIESIREIGRKSGEEVVASGEKPGFFTVDSPAFKTYRPKFEDVDGKMQAVTDSAGNVVMDRVPLYIANEFEGPLKSIMSDKPGKIYSGLMSLKSKATGLIMYSPLIHNGVEWGRALPLMPGKVATFRIYFEGNEARKDSALMREFVEGGMVPIGKRFQNQDISGIVEEPTLKPGRSLTAKALGGATGLVNKAAGEAVKRGVDKAGDVWHNTLLWDRVADLQAGIALNMRDEYVAKGIDRQTATRMASHLANRFAGALPNEAMSAMARKVANLSLFSRTFTLGNMGVMKDIFTGLPKDVQAQIRRDAGVVAAQGAVSAARRTAIHAFVLDIALMYAANAALQSAFDYWKRDKSLDEISKGYVDRMNRLFDKVKEDPTTLLNPFGMLGSLSPTSENEPGKENRVLFGYAKDGTAIYVRVPTGKIGEEFTDWPTSPIDMLKRKESTLLRPTLQLLQNDKGFGREVYDAKAKGFTGAVTNMGRIVWNYMSQQLPMDSITAAGDLMKARGDDDVNALKVVGPLFGVTFSKGAPGGPATGQLMEVNREHTAQIRRAMPDVRELIKDGKTGEALALMDKSGFTPAEKRTTLRFATNPGVITQRRMQHYNQIATPEEIEAMRRMRQSDR